MFGFPAISSECWSQATTATKMAVTIVIGIAEKLFFVESKDLTGKSRYTVILETRLLSYYPFALPS